MLSMPFSSRNLKVIIVLVFIAANIIAKLSPKFRLRILLSMKVAKPTNTVSINIIKRS